MSPSLISTIDFVLFVFAIPFFLSFFIIIAWMKYITRKDKTISQMHGRVEFIRFIFTFHTDKGLMQQGLLWLSLITPLVYFFCLGGIAWHDCTLRLDAEGFKTFISISTLPLAVLSLSIPLSVLVARFHTSRQTAEQIKITRQKNNVDLFHSHRKELFGYFQQLGDFHYHDNLIAKNRIHPRVHKSYFEGNPRDGVPEVRVDAFARVENLLRRTRSELKSIITSESPHATFTTYLASFGSNIHELANLLGLPEIIDLMDRSPKVPCKIKDKDLHLETVGTSTDEAISAFKYTENFFHNLCDFASYESRYFADHESYNDFMEVVRINGKLNSREKIIEQLHENQIAEALETEEYNKFYPNSRRS